VSTTPTDFLGIDNATANGVRIAVTVAAVFTCTKMFLAHETEEKASMKNIFLSMENLFSSPIHHF
jgi:hypothetical protein